MFKIAFERWVGERKPRPFAAHIRAAVEALKVIAAEGKAQAKQAGGRR